MKRIYIKNLKDNKKKSLEEFILKFRNLNDDYSKREFKKTYYANNNKLQCKTARRSFYDIVMLIKFYRPKETKKTIAKALLNVLKTDLVTNWCPDIEKHVFFFYSLHFIEYKKINWGGTSTKNFENKGKGKYSLKDFLILAGAEKKDFDTLLYEYKTEDFDDDDEIF